MVTKYPNDIDTDAELPRVDDNVSEVSADTINAMREAIIAIQRTLGENPQGSTANLVNRISESIGEDGTLKSSALLAAGLISLPITNSQISATAAIEEAKLNLDVATQNLQDQISSNDIDIANLQKSIANIINDFALHVSGQAFKHDSFDILLDSDYPSSTPPSFAGLTASDVGNAMIEMNNRFIDHASVSKVEAHKASNISVDGLNFISIPTTTSDTQTALEELDKVKATELIRHRDHMHANGFDNWANNVEGYNELNQLFPTTFGSKASALIFPSIRNKLRFTGINLNAQGVSQGDVVVIPEGVAAGTYIIDDVGPRPAGARPILTSEELEVTTHINNVSLVPSATVEAQIFGASSAFTFKSNVAPTIRQNTSLDSVQCSRPNAAKVITLGIKPYLFNASDTLDITVGLDNNTSRSISISNLDENRVGVVNNITIDTMVDRINSIFHGAANFPASAYRVGDELMLSHNWDGYVGYFIRVDSSGNANDKFGFDGYGADVVDFDVPPTKSSAFYVGGSRFTSFKLLHVGSASATGSFINFSDFDPLESGVREGHLVQIKNHTTVDDNGTYTIIGVGSNSIELHTTIGTSTVDVEIQYDCSPLTSLANSGNTQLIENFIDREAKLSWNVRLDYDNTIANLRVIDVSDNAIPATIKLFSELTATGHNLYIDDGNVAVKTPVPSGFIGTKKVWTTSNIEFITVDIVGALGVSPFGGSDVIINEHVDEEEVLEVCSIRSDGSFTLFDLIDKRLFGSIGLDEIREDVVQAYIETPLAELRSNGVVRGFDLPDTENPNDPHDGYFLDFVYPSNGALLIRGGTVYVEGVRCDVRTQAVIFPVPNTSTTYTVCLNKIGNYEIIDIADYTLEQIIDGSVGALLPIVQVDHNGSSGPYPLSNPVDVRRFINNIDEKVDLILDTTNNMIGSFLTAEAAIKYANSYPSSEKFVIRIVSFDERNNIVIPSNSRDLTLEIDGYVGNITVNSRCKIRGRGVSDRGNQSHIAGTVNVNTDCLSFEVENLNIEGDVNIAVTDLVLLTPRSKKVLFNNVKFTGDVSITDGFTVGFEDREEVKFINCVWDSGSAGISDTTQSINLFLSKCKFLSGSIYADKGTGSDHIIITDTIFRGILPSGEKAIFDNYWTELKGCIFEETPGNIAINGGSIYGCKFQLMDLNGVDLITVGNPIGIGSSINTNINSCLFYGINLTSNAKIITYVALGGEEPLTVTNCSFRATQISTNTPVVEASYFNGCLAFGTTGNFVVKATSFTNNFGFEGMHYAPPSPTVYRPLVIQNNIFEPSNTLGQQVIIQGNAARDTSVLISGNRFELEDFQDGILLGEDLPTSLSHQIIITNNYFFVNGVDTPNSAINLFRTGSTSAGLSTEVSRDKNIIISENIFRGDRNNSNNLTAITNAADIEGLILENNIFDYADFNIAISDNCSISHNKFTTSTGTTSGADIEKLRVIGNVIHSSKIIIGGGLLANGVFADNTGGLGGGIAFDTSQMSQCIITGNVGGINISENASPVTLDGCIFSNNYVFSTFGDVVATWNESIFTQNYIARFMSINALRSVEISQNVVVSNIASLGLSINPVGTIDNCIIADNIGIGDPVGVGGIRLFIRSPITSSAIKSNINFEIYFEDTVSNSLIVNNVSSFDLTIDGNTTSCFISQNIFNEVEINSQLTNQLKLTGNIVANALKFGEGDISGQLSITNSIIDANTVGTQILFGGTSATVVSASIPAATLYIFSDNIISNNVCQNIDTLNYTSADASSPVTITNNVFSGNKLSQDLQFFGDFTAAYSNINNYIDNNFITGNDVYNIIFDTNQSTVGSSQGPITNTTIDNNTCINEILVDRILFDGLYITNNTMIFGDIEINCRSSVSNTTVGSADVSTYSNLIVSGNQFLESQNLNLFGSAPAGDFIQYVNFQINNNDFGEAFGLIDIEQTNPSFGGWVATSTDPREPAIDGLTIDNNRVQNIRIEDRFNTGQVQLFHNVSVSNNIFTGNSSIVANAGLVVDIQSTSAGAILNRWKIDGNVGIAHNVDFSTDGVALGIVRQDTDLAEPAAIAFNADPGDFGYFMIDSSMSNNIYVDLLIYQRFTMQRSNLSGNTNTAIEVSGAGRNNVCVIFQDCNMVSNFFQSRARTFGKACFQDNSSASQGLLFERCNIASNVFSSEWFDNFVAGDPCIEMNNASSGFSQTSITNNVFITGNGAQNEMGQMNECLFNNNYLRQTAVNPGTWNCEFWSGNLTGNRAFSATTFFAGLTIGNFQNNLDINLDVTGQIYQGVISGNKGCDISCNILGTGNADPVTVANNDNCNITSIGDIYCNFSTNNQCTFVGGSTYFGTFTGNRICPMTFTGSTTLSTFSATGNLQCNFTIAGLNSRVQTVFSNNHNCAFLLTGGGIQSEFFGQIIGNYGLSSNITILAENVIRGSISHNTVDSILLSAAGLDSSTDGENQLKVFANTCNGTLDTDAAHNADNGLASSMFAWGNTQRNTSVNLTITGVDATNTGTANKLNGTKINP